MILGSDTEKTIWADRLVNGPYKTIGDSFSYSPGDGDEIVLRAEKLLNDTVDDFWDGDFDTPSGLDYYTYNKGHYVLACAFYYYLTGNTTYGAKAKAAILTQVNASNPIFENYSAPLGSNIFHFSAFSTRIMYAYDYCSDLFNTTEQNQVLTWLGRQLNMWRGDSEYWPLAMFPNRNSRDYSVTASYASTGEDLQGVVEAKKWTHKDSSGTYQNNIKRVHIRWFNAHAYMNLWLISYGALIDDTTIIDRAKIWYEEYLKYACWPDGNTGECFRNGDYPTVGYPSGSLHYEVVVLESMIISAEILRRRGDNSLYTYSTTVGIWGNTDNITQKNIRNNLANKIESCKMTEASSFARYYETVDSNHLLDTLFVTYRYKPEPMMAIANKRYQEQELTDTYTLVNAANPYGAGGSSYGGPLYNTDSHGVGEVGVLPAIHLMFYGLENVFVYPVAIAGTDQSISVSTSVLNGTGSDSDGSIVSYLWEQVSGPNTANILTPSGSSSIVNGLIVGDYVFRLTVTDNDGLTDTDTVTITVNPTTTTTKANARVLL